MPNFESSIRHTTSTSSDWAVAEASGVVAEALRGLRKAAVVEDLVFERLSVTASSQNGDIEDGLVLFACKISGSVPPHRKRIWFPVYIREGQIQELNHFRDSTEREYPLNEATVHAFLGTDMGTFRQMKTIPHVERSLTDRTVLPTLPARNFFSLAMRRRAQEPGEIWTHESFGGQFEILPSDDEFTVNYRDLATGEEHSTQIDLWHEQGMVKQAASEDDEYDDAAEWYFEEAQPRLGYNDSAVPSFDDTATGLEERWVDHEDPTTSSRRLALSPVRDTEFWYQNAWWIIVFVNEDEIGAVAQDFTGGHQLVFTPLEWEQKVASGEIEIGDGIGSHYARRIANAMDADMELVIGGEPCDPAELTGWSLYEKTEPVAMVQMDADFEVETLEGPMSADAGDYLALGIEGEMWPVDEDIQEQTHQALEPIDDIDEYLEA